MTNPHRILIVGGGGTGAAVAYDLAQRGFQVTLLERGELTSGTTGRHHGQLHSGARYAVDDPLVARECARESGILRKIAPEAIEFNFGLFIALTPEDEEYRAPFLDGCSTAGIPAKLLSASDALRMEPGINPKVRFAVQVPEGTMDAFRLPLHFFAAAKKNGASIRTFAEVTGIEVRGRAAAGVKVLDHRSGREVSLGADMVINAAGPWAGKVAALAGAVVPVSPSPGTLAAVKGRLSNMVVSRLHPPGDGDTVVPQRNLSIIGTTGSLVENPDDTTVDPGEVKGLFERADDLIPGFSRAALHAAWTAVRPLTGTGGVFPGDQGTGASGSRGLSRDFVLYDHGERDDLEGFLTITGGKATVLRAMAEATADMVCARFGIDAPCRTADSPLAHYRTYFH
jgi:glycerol-3-phosphate dehydrogenase